MFDANDLLRAIKVAATEAVEVSKPSDFCFGNVTSTSPLKISIDQKLTLGVAQLVLTRNVTNYTTSVTVDWETESDGSHNHKISNTKKMTIHNALQVGDKVVLLKQKGGQKYLVLDRVVKA